MTCFTMHSDHGPTAKGLPREIEEPACPVGRFSKCFGTAGTGAFMEKRKAEFKGD